MNFSNPFVANRESLSPFFKSNREERIFRTQPQELVFSSAKALEKFPLVLDRRRRVRVRDDDDYDDYDG